MEPAGRDPPPPAPPPPAADPVEPIALAHHAQAPATRLPVIEQPVTERTRQPTNQGAKLLGDSACAYDNFANNCKRFGYRYDRADVKGTDKGTVRPLLDCLSTLLLQQEPLLEAIGALPLHQHAGVKRYLQRHVQGVNDWHLMLELLAKALQVRITLLTSHAERGIHTFDPANKSTIRGAVELGTLDGKHFFPVELPPVSEDMHAIPPLAQIVCIAILALWNFGALVLNKLSLAAYAHLAPTPGSIVELFLTLVAPAAVTLPFALAVHLVREGKDNKQEKRRVHMRRPGLFWLVFLEALLEAGGLSTLAIFVLPKYSALAAFVILQTLRWVPALVLLALRIYITPVVGFTRIEYFKPIAMVVCSICAFTGLTVLFFALRDWVTLLCVLAISLSHWRAWSAPLKESAEAGRRGRVAWLVQAVHSGQRFHRYWMATAHCLLFVAFTTAYFLIAAKRHHRLSPGDLGTAFRSLGESHTLGAFVTQLVTGLAAFLGCWVALCAGSGKSRLIFAAFVLPMATATLSAFVIVLVLCGDGTHHLGALGSIAATCAHKWDVSMPAVIFAGVALSIGALCTLLPKAELAERLGVKTERELWGRPGYTSLIAEQSLDLNCSLVEHTAHAHQKNHKTFIVGTLWRELEDEMRGFVRSTADLSKKCCRRLEEFTAILMFDEAFTTTGRENDHVRRLKRVLREFGLEPRYAPKRPWFGDCFHVVLPGPGVITLYVVLKNTQRVQQLKRWSHVLSLDLIFEYVRSNSAYLRSAETSVYALLVDGDTKFSKGAFDLLRAQLDEEPSRVGAVSGRIAPQGPPHMLVWFQVFSYAAGHWFQKAAEHVLGTVLCAPGCFTLVRLPAFYRQAGESQFGLPNGSRPEQCALEEYAKNPDVAMAYLSYNQGEDRLLSTLFILNGWLLQYNSSSIPVTSCPCTVVVYFKQQRRWGISTNVNMVELLQAASELVARNRGISWPYMAYTAVVVVCSVLAPTITTLVTMGGLQFGLHLPAWLTFTIGLGLPLFYIGVCAAYKIEPVRRLPNGTVVEEPPEAQEQKRVLQVKVGEVLGYVYAVLMALSLLAILVQAAFARSIVEVPAVLFIAAMAAMFVIAALFHGDVLILLYGPVYLFMLPFNYVVLPIFVYANLHDLSWGTRDAAAPANARQRPLVVFSCASFWRWLIGLLRGCHIDTGLKEADDAHEEAERGEGTAAPAVQAASGAEEERKVAPEADNMKWLEGFVAPDGSVPEPQPRELRSDGMEEQLCERLQRLSDYLMDIQRKIRKEMRRPEDRVQEKQREQKLRFELAELQQNVARLLLAFSLIVVVLASASAFAPSEGSWAQSRRITFGFVVVAASASPVVLQFCCMLLYRFGALVSNMRAATRTALFDGSSCFHGDDDVQQSEVPAEVLGVAPARD